MPPKIPGADFFNPSISLSINSLISVTLLLIFLAVFSSFSIIPNDFKTFAKPEDNLSPKSGLSPNHFSAVLHPSKNLTKPTTEKPNINAFFKKSNIPVAKSFAFPRPNAEPSFLKPSPILLIPVFKSLNLLNNSAL